MLNFWWRRHKRLVQRQAQAREELARSRQLLAEAREVTAPIQAAAAHNQFADMIREALSNGRYRTGNKGGTHGTAG